MWRGRRIVVGVTGGIAAYKAAELVSRLRQEGAEVRVIMTKAALEFVTPVTFAALSGNPVCQDMFLNRGYVSHIDLAQTTDLIMVVPATADILARLAGGLADELLCAVLLATRAPVLLAPSMNSNMYTHPATNANMARLRDMGYHLLEPETGFLACGTQGPGRLPPVDDILEAAAGLLGSQAELKGVKVVVTAGGTREYLDPVRFLGNPSSGKMGYSVAVEARNRGAEVVLVSGPVALEPPYGVQLIKVESAEEMYQAVLQHSAEAGVVVKAAAVADFRPKQRSFQKIKKGTALTVLELEPTTDILAELGRRKPGGQILVGFAAETADAVEHGWSKLWAKNLDMIVVNDVTRAGAGFATDTNIVSFLYSDGRVEELSLMSKSEVARRLLDAVQGLLSVREG